MPAEYLFFSLQVEVKGCAVLLIMDDLERELVPLEDDFSDEASSKGDKRTKLPLVNPISKGTLYNMYCHTKLTKKLQKYSEQLSAIKSISKTNV